jgi:hypothetical protein
MVSSALQWAQLVATFGAALFAGAAVYINLVEHPARMGQSTEVAASVWATSYQRATWMQAPLAFVSCAAGAAAWWLSRDLPWFVGAAVIGSVIPYTLLVIAPTNRALLAPGRDLASPDSRALLDRWARLHAARSLLSVAASVTFLWQLVSR